MCPCLQKPGSSNVEAAQWEYEGQATNKNWRGSVQTQGVSKEQKENMLYNNMVRREIKEILDDKVYAQRPKSAHFSTSTKFDFEVYTDENSSNVHHKAKSTVPANDHHGRRRHSCSTPWEDEKQHYVHQEIVKNKKSIAVEGRLGTNARTYFLRESLRQSQMPVYRKMVENNQGEVQCNANLPTGTNQYKDGQGTVSRPPLLAAENQRDHSISPIPSNPFTSQHNLISRKPQRLRDPKVISRIAKINYRNETFLGGIYNEEYLDDIFRNIRRQEPKITLKQNFLQRYNPNYKYRARILNWLLKEQPSLNYSESEYYLTVNLLDHILAKLPIPLNMYQLVAVVCLWIMNKFIGSGHIRTSSLLDICDGAFLSLQLVKMEVKVLNIMQFNLHTTEPSICVNYYLKKFTVENNILVKRTVYYVLDAFSLTPEFSSVPVSILAAACVRYTLVKYLENMQDGINAFFRRILSQDDMNQIKYVESLLFLQLDNMSDENYMFKEPFNKHYRRKNQANL